MEMPEPDESAPVGDGGDEHPVVAAAAMKKSAWTKEEDAVLREQVRLHGGPQNWAAISEAFPGRNPKSCRLRWWQHLSPTVETTKAFTPQEDGVVLEQYRAYPNKWATIAGFLPGRTDNNVKNRWHSVLHKTYPQYLQQQQEQEQQQRAAAAVPGGIPRHRHRHRRRLLLPDGTLPLFPLAPGDVGGRGMSVPGLRSRHHPPPDGAEVEVEDEVDLSGECLELFPLVPGDLLVGVRGGNAGEAAAAAMDVDEPPLLELRLVQGGGDGAGSSAGDLLDALVALASSA